MDLRGKKILITGGAGFIGSYITESLVQKEAKVTVFDNFSSGRMDNLQTVKDKIKIIKGDILDYPALEKACQGMEIISHQAAQLEIFRCLEDPILDLKTNIIGTLNVLNAAVKNRVKMILNASSACVYGQAQSIPQNEEGHPKNPNWPYGVSKLAAEKYCRIYSELHGIPIVSLRYGIVYGEREWFGRVLTVFCKRVLSNQNLIVFGDGGQCRDFVYVGDVVDMHNRCLEKEVIGEYNVATGIKTTISKLAELVIEGSGKDLKVIYENPKEGEFSRHMPERKRIPQELKAMVLDISKAKKDLEYEAKVNLKEGIKRELKWARMNLEYWEVKDIVHV